jgi:hypothetical protein
MTDDEVYVRLGPGEEVYIPEWASAGSSIPEGVSTRRTGGASAGSSKPEGVSTEPPDLRQALLAVRSGDDPAVAAGATARTPRARVTPRACTRAKVRVAQLPHHTVRATASYKLLAKAKAAKIRARFTKAATKKRLLQGKCRKCRGIYTPQELGQGPQYRKKHYADARAKCLQQVYYRAPRLPLRVEIKWLAHKYAFARECQSRWKASTGYMFSQRVNLLIASLGVHYHGHEDVKAKLTPQAKAWLAKNCTSTDNPRAFEEFVVGLHVYLPKKYEPDEMRLVLF